jgi:CHAD domain-containing protein
VQIKKLKAMLCLFEGTSRQHGLLKDFKPVRKIFRNAGNIRDAHTNLQLSERYNLKNELFETDQQKIIEKGTKEFRLNGKKYLKNIKETHKQLKKQLPKVDDDLIAEYYKKQLEQIAGNLATATFTEEMHDNRKLIKILVYNHKMADKALNGSFHFNIEYLDKLQSRIGEWHDNVIAAQLFSSPEINDKPVATQINKKNVSVKRNITALANDFLKKATEAEETVIK